MRWNAGNRIFVLKTSQRAAAVGYSDKLTHPPIYTSALPPCTSKNLKFVLLGALCINRHFQNIGIAKRGWAVGRGSLFPHFGNARILKVQLLIPTPPTRQAGCRLGGPKKATGLCIWQHPLLSTLFYIGCLVPSL